MALVACLPVLAFADEPKKQPNKNSNNESVAVPDTVQQEVSECAIKETKNLMNNFKTVFSAVDKDKKWKGLRKKLNGAIPNDYKEKKENEKEITKANELFIYDNSLQKINADFSEDWKKVRFTDVFGELVQKGMKNQFTCDTNTIKVREMKLIKSKNGDYTYHVTVGLENRNEVSKMDSTVTHLTDVRYYTTLVWKIDATTEINRKTNLLYLDCNAKVLSCEVDSIPYLDIEKKDMQSIAENAIKDWYNNLQYNLDVDKLKKYDSRIEVLGVPNVDVVVDGKMDFENLTYTGTGRRVKIDIDPSPFIAKEEMYLYESDDSKPSATVTFNPVFSVQITNEPYSLKDKPEVKYEDVEIGYPSTIEEKTTRKAGAEEFIKDYSNKLAEYASAEKSERAALRTGLEAMFASNSVIIEVSYLPKGGKERKIERKVGKYLTLLKDADLTVTDIECKEVDNNVVSIIYSYTQSFRGKKYSKYSDEVTKVVKMEYQNENDRWVITGITIDGPTRPYKSL